MPGNPFPGFRQNIPSRTIKTLPDFGLEMPCHSVFHSPRFSRFDQNMGCVMRDLGQFQIDQMRKGDPRLPQLFKTLRAALDLLEDIAARPHREPERTPEPVSAPPPVRLPAQDNLAYSIKDIRALAVLLPAL